VSPGGRPQLRWSIALDIARPNEHYRRAMAGRTMYVIAFCMGPLDTACGVPGIMNRLNFATGRSYAAKEMRCSRMTMTAGQAPVAEIAN
jgi:GTP-dependent phosphoenolpyruvate carboxykinase